MKIIASLLFISLFSYTCSNDERISAIFDKPMDSYINKPIKMLILDSKKELVGYNYYNEDGLRIINGVYLIFSDSTTIVATFDEYKYVKPFSENGDWNINLCIIENVKEIKIRSPNGDIRNVDCVKYVLKDSLIIQTKPWPW